MFYLSTSETLPVRGPEWLGLLLPEDTGSQGIARLQAWDTEEWDGFPTTWNISITAG